MEDTKKTIAGFLAEWSSLFLALVLHVKHLFPGERSDRLLGRFESKNENANRSCFREFFLCK